MPGPATSSHMFACRVLKICCLYIVWWSSFIKNLAHIQAGESSSFDGT